MLSRFISFSSSTRTFLIRSLTLAFTPSSILPPPPLVPRPLSPLPPPHLPRPSRASFSSRGSSGGGGDDGRWKLTPEPDDADESLFEAPEAGDLVGLADSERSQGGPIPTDDATGAGWAAAKVGVGEAEEQKGGDIFEAIDRELEAEKGGSDYWKTAKGFKPWGFGEEEKEEKGDMFGIVDNEPAGDLDAFREADVDNERAEEVAKLELQEKELKAVLKGPDRAFGDLIAASGITDEMLESLILLKDVRGVEGLPSLREIEDMYIEKSDDTGRFAEEQKKQEEIAKTRVKKVDEKGRAYGTGRRKCSIARVFIQPGDGTFIVNDKQFDAYFPCLDHRADLLSPFNVTDTVGQWDVYCTVKGGGVSGQVGAIRLGISRALQNFEPGFRQYLRPAGFLTRDPRVVERKKPGKAKARKSFQWVKR